MPRGAASSTTGEGQALVLVESPEHLVFYLLAVVALAGALGVVFSRDIIHAALYLIVTLMMTAGVYVLLSAEFLSLVQVLVYGGGVSILVLFAVMITRVRDTRVPLEGPQRPFALVAGIAVAAVLALMVVRSDWRLAVPAERRPERSPVQVQRVTTTTPEGTVRDTNAVGHELFTTFAVPFEVASLVLLVALIGAIILARGEEEEVT